MSELYFCVNWINTKGDLKVPFLIATTLWCRGGCYCLPWIAPLILDPYLIMLNVRQGGIKFNFLSFWVWLILGLNIGLPIVWETRVQSQHYVWIKSKWSNSGKSVVPSPTPWCNSYWKGSLWVTLDHGRPTYIHMCVCVNEKNQHIKISK